jgi:hypothetical protein
LADETTAVEVVAAVTVSVAFEVGPVNPAIFVAVAKTLLLNVPAALVATLAEIWHEAPGASVELAKLIEVEPPLPEAAPLQLLVKPLGVATTIPLGKLSVNVIPFRVVFALVLLTVMVSFETAPKGMLVGANALLTLGGLMTVMLAVAKLPVSPPASVAVTLPLVLF